MLKNNLKRKLENHLFDEEVRQLNILRKKILQQSISVYGEYLEIWEHYGRTTPELTQISERVFQRVVGGFKPELFTPILHPGQTGYHQSQEFKSDHEKQIFLRNMPLQKKQQFEIWNVEFMEDNRKRKEISDIFASSKARGEARLERIDELNMVYSNLTNLVNEVQYPNETTVRTNLDNEVQEQVSESESD